VYVDGIPDRLLARESGAVICEARYISADRELPFFNM
jgi:hypothetical protein